MRQIVPILLFISLALFSCDEKMETQVVEVKTDKRILSCDAEDLGSQEDKSVFISGDDKFGNGENQDNAFAHSGEYSAKVTKDSPNAFTIGLDGISAGDMIEISVWRKTSCQSISSYAVLENAGGKKEIVDNIISIDGDWELIHKNILIEEVGDSHSFSIYVFSDCDADTWFDDLEVIVHENLGVDYNYPKFEGEEKIKIELSTDQLRKLQIKRSEALEYGLLVSEENDIVFGTMHYNGKSFPIELRLKGDLLSHLDGVKWSFRVKVKKGSFNGIRTFSLHSPAARGMLDEWVMHKLYSEEDVLSTRYGFIPLELNGQSLGVYAWEEHFEKQLLESQKRREGPIVRLKEDALCEARRRDNLNDSAMLNGSVFAHAEISPYRKGKTLKSSILNEQYSQAKNLVYQHQKQSTPASELFDVDRLAIYYALADLGQTTNGVQWNKQRFYFNPVLSRLEPIAFAAYSGTYRQPSNRLIGHEEALERLNGELPYTLFPSGDEQLISEYLNELKRFSNKEYLDAFFEENKVQIEIYEELLQSEFSHYNFNEGQHFYQNQKLLSKNISEYEVYLEGAPVNFVTNKNFNSIKGLNYKEPVPDMGVKLYLQDTSGQNSYQAMNLHSTKMELLGFGNVVAITNELKKPKVLEPYYSSGKTYTVKSDSEYYYYRVQGRVEVYKEKVNMWSYPEANTARQQYEKSASIPSSFSKSENQLLLKKGKHTFSKNVFIPQGYTVIVEEGADITIHDKVSFVSYSPIQFKGTADNPIMVASNASDGLSVIGADGRSNISHTTFSGFDTQKIEGWRLTGAVNFFESDVDISSCHFLNNVCEDGLNIIHSDFTLSNSEISGTFSDGFDADYCTGKVSDCIFKNNGNDCMDFSTSVVEIVSCSIIKAGDKGVSGGENSTLLVKNISIKDAKIGIASKDQSEVVVEDVQLENCTYGFAVFQKKIEYGPASIKVDDAETINVETLKLVELNSVLEYDGDIIQGTDSLDIDVLYDL